MRRQLRAMLLSMLLGGSVTAQTAEEYHVKAAFLYNFAKFVEWPPQTFRSPSDPISVCVLGKNPFGAALEQAVNRQRAQGRTFLVREVTDAAQSSSCQILFVSSSERKRLPQIFRDLKTFGVLTVGESDNFTSEGGAINFRIEDGSVRIQINPDAAAREQVRISSKLLGLAEIVRN